MKTWTRAASVAVATLFVAPFVMELWGIYMKGEDFHPLRMAFLGALLIVAQLFFAVLWRAGRHLRLALGIVTLLGAVFAILMGVLIAIPWFTVHGISDVYVGIAVALVGLIICGAGVYLIYIDVRGVDLGLVANEPAEQRDDQEVEVNGQRVYVRKYRHWQENDADVMERCELAVELEGLHFIGYYVRGSCRFSVDVLDDARLNVYFRDSTRDERRAIYEQAGRRVIWLVDKLSPYVRRIEGGVPVRLAIDVEWGGMFYHWVVPNVYLVGYTLDERSVNKADVRLQTLSEEAGFLPRGYPIIT